MMSGQTDTAWGSFPFNYDLINKGEARVIGTGAEAGELEGYTIRVQAANANFLKQHRDVAVRFMRAYHRALDWQYKNPEPAIKRWAETYKLDPESARQVTKFVPYSTVTLAPIGNLDGNVNLAVEFKMLSQPLTEAQKKELVDIVFDPGPGK
jgi:ABC-type nitrate/sulfonate/bicarbonate transport system substrate-binding protein